jgi:glycosyltransferase involved in cell wall biosynthesis
MKVLFIAYYFEPFSGVGAKRVSYWAKNLKRIDNDIIKCDVITATPQSSEYDNIDNVFFVENTNQGLLSKLIKYDKGASWLYDLQKFVKTNIKQNGYDFVILTGGPFWHFFLINDLQKLGIKTILDFRDPFANNPRGIRKKTLAKIIKHFILKKVENYFLSNSNVAISVNQYCLELFENYKKYEYKLKIIDNGYDEQLFINILKQENNVRLSNNTINFAYAGKLYRDRNPQVFFQCLEKYSFFNFFYIGEKSEYIKKDNQKIYSLGLMTYEKTIEKLSAMDVCMIFTSGHSFESTTKIFDYMALKKFIFIITDGEVRTGQIHHITKDYPRIYWSKNSSKDIEEALIQIQNDLVESKEIEFDSSSYSREYGLKKLIQLIRSS